MQWGIYSLHNLQSFPAINFGAGHNSQLFEVFKICVLKVHDVQVVKFEQDRQSIPKEV